MLLLSISSFDLRVSRHLEIDCMQAIFLRKGEKVVVYSCRKQAKGEKFLQSKKNS